MRTVTAYFCSRGRRTQSIAVGIYRRRMVDDKWIWERYWTGNQVWEQIAHETFPGSLVSRLERVVRSAYWGHHESMGSVILVVE